MIYSELLFTIAFWFFLTASIFYIITLVFQWEGIGKAATIVTIAAFIATTLALIYRTVESGHAPMSNLYESLILFSWAIVLIYLFFEFKYRTRIFGCFVVPLGFLSLAIASLLPRHYKALEPLVPALQSYWLWIHVITCFIGYAGFALAFGLSIMYLLKVREKKPIPSILSGLPDAEFLDNLSYKSTAIGFCLLALGIITGAIWANYAWGTYWSWDPKETWSLITWLIYAAYLHARLAAGWRGRRAAYISIAGFLSVLFTYFGVSFLLSGLHAYL